MVYLTVFCISVACRDPCKAYIGGHFYDLEGADPKLNIALGPKFRLMANLCKPVDIRQLEEKGFRLKENDHYKGKFPNIVIAYQLSETSGIIYPLSYIDSDSEKFWEVSLGSYRNYWNSLKKNSRSAIGSEEDKETPNNSTEVKVTTVKILDHEQYEGKHIKLVDFSFRCEKNPSLAMHYGYYDANTHQAKFGYSGPSACPIDLPDYIMFFSRNISFLALLFITSFIGLFIGKKYERLAMSLTSVQATVMILSGVLIYLTLHLRSDLEDKKEYFEIVLALSALVIFCLSFFYRIVANFFMGVSVSYTITWTFLYLGTVFFHTNISFTILLIINTAVMTLIVFSNCYFTIFRERYSYGIFTGLTNPFYLCMSISVFLGVYLDIITFDKFKNWGKYDSVSWKSWIFIPIQLLFTTFFFVKVLWWDQKGRLRSISNLDLLAKKLSEDKRHFLPSGTGHCTPDYSPEKNSPEFRVHVHM